MIKYRSYRIIDRRPRWIIVDENENIINKNPDKEELKSLEDYKRKAHERYTDNDLQNYLKKYYEETGRVPTARDFTNNPEYPGANIYWKRFGSWNKALKLVDLDTDTMIKLGVLQDTNYKGRLFEIIVRDLFENKSTDFSIEKHDNPCDGICPQGKSYDAKSSKLYRLRGEYWMFNIRNKYKEEIEYYYFGAFNEDYTKLMYVWRVPGEIIEKDYFVIGLNRNWEHNIENMKEYDITDKFKDIYIKYKLE